MVGFAYIVIYQRTQQYLSDFQTFKDPPEYHKVGHKYIVFLGIDQGQGIGNIMNGLLAVHLLGHEFNRTVCIDGDLEDFLQYFDIVNKDILEHCPSMGKPPMTSLNQINLITYVPNPNECRIQQKLASNVEIIFVRGNTYPSWPPVPPNFFLQFYKPKPTLLNRLPYSNPPTTVVHLRKPDGSYDVRLGLDPKSLDALGRMMPSDTYLVTNYVDWFHYFASNFGWKHANWTRVQHSALDHIDWNSPQQRQGAYEQDDTDDIGNRDSESEWDTQQQFQLWVDWWTILTAQKVYHTHSDMSLSAIHWMNIESKTIRDYNDTSDQVDLVVEYWRHVPPTPPLVERTRMAWGRGRLQNCQSLL